MKQFTSNELRKAWKDFYIKRGHVDCGAVSLVSDGSTGVLFNVAGMQPLMPYLLGQKHPLGTRLCNVQGCVRTNDIDSVGDKSHATFFEMMGSWSLGDYFKEDRCKWSYELLTEVFGFDRDHIAATVFAGDENAPRDEEGAQCRINSGIKKENIFYLPAEDNWWGLEFGPCGPDSEMFYIADVPDCGPNCGPGCKCGKYTELGNDVFMQYEKHKDGTLTPLAKKNVDTGWGLERNLAFLNGTKDVYRTDVYEPVINYISKISGAKYDEDEKLTRSMRILADHTRTSVMLIGDEAKLTPANSGAGYVLRRLICRAIRHARILSLKKENILEIARIYIDEIYSEAFPLLVTNRAFILSELTKEIERFESTLENGLKEYKKILDTIKAANGKAFSGKDAFYLYDTFGFPYELTVEMAEEEGLSVDEEGFDKAMEEQKQKARDNMAFAQKNTSSIFDTLHESVKSEFTGYINLSDKSPILALASETEIVAELNGKGTVITAYTPFYATMGGQEGDKGIIKTDSGVFKVEDTIKLPGGRIGHIGEITEGSVKVGETATLHVDKEYRADTAKNHTATHILQEALREVLGDHVEQKGSLVNAERLRFDFSHGAAVTKEELEKVEAIVNKKIAEHIDVVTKELPIEEARKTGAKALFGEKYGDIVRVVDIGGWSIEFCGGTHVKNTGDIASFKILSESGIAAGVRRIEALTGNGVLSFYKEQEDMLLAAAKAVKCDPRDLVKKVEALLSEIKEIKNENESLKNKLAANAAGDILNNVTEKNGVKMIAAIIEDAAGDALKTLGDEMKAKLGCAFVLFVGIKDGKVSIVSMATDDAVAKGAHCGNLIREVAGILGGGGGGRPNMAQAGGKDASKAAEAVEKAKEIMASQIK
ncbi:MAG: alanine--tRNA ligase [Lachnospiraceae bacterium]|nr:alanine--tRNA ligase [Lachnospiraceae bacterium]